MASQEDRIKQYLDSRLEQQSKALLEDNAEIKTEQKSTREALEILKETMNGRLKKLEIKNAYREGAEKASTGAVVPGGDQDWKKATFKLLAILTAIVAVASTAATIVAKELVK